MLAVSSLTSRSPLLHRSLGRSCSASMTRRWLHAAHQRIAQRSQQSLESLAKVLDTIAFSAEIADSFGLGMINDRLIAVIGENHLSLKYQILKEKLKEGARRGHFALGLEGVPRDERFEKLMLGKNAHSEYLYGIETHDIHLLDRYVLLNNWLVRGVEGCYARGRQNFVLDLLTSPRLRSIWHDIRETPTGEPGLDQKYLRTGRLLDQLIADGSLSNVGNLMQQAQQRVPFDSLVWALISQRVGSRMLNDLSMPSTVKKAVHGILKCPTDKAAQEQFLQEHNGRWRTGAMTHHTKSITMDMPPDKVLALVLGKAHVSFFKASMNGKGPSFTVEY